MENFATRTKALLKMKNMRQQDLVNKTGIAKSTITQYLKNARKPRKDNIKKIAKVLEVSPKYLEKGEGDRWNPFGEEFSFLSSENIWGDLSEKERVFLTSISATEKDTIKALRNGSKRTKDLILFALGKAVIVPNHEYDELLKAKEMCEKYSKEIGDLENQSLKSPAEQMMLTEFFSGEESNEIMEHKNYEAKDE